MNYDSSNFDPPAPVALVILRNLESDRAVSDVPMLMDSGSDLTLLPRKYLDDLELTFSEANTYELEGFDGTRTIAQSVNLGLTFLRRTFRGRFVVINSQNGILGRNVLNHFALLLDGPHLNWIEMGEPSN